MTMFGLWGLYVPWGSLCCLLVCAILSMRAHMMALLHWHKIARAYRLHSCHVEQQAPSACCLCGVAIFLVWSTCICGM